MLRKTKFHMHADKVKHGRPINLSLVHSFEKYGDRMIRFYFGPEDYEVWEFATKEDADESYEMLLDHYVEERY